MSEQVEEKNLVKSAEELLGAATELAKSQICTGTQPKVSHPDSTTSNQTEGDAVADNGTDYKGGKPSKKDTALRKAVDEVMEKIAKGEALSSVDQLVLQSAIDSDIVKGDDKDKKKKNPFAKEEDEDEKGLEKAIEANEQTGVNAAPALRAFADEISKSYAGLVRELNELRKGIGDRLETIEKSVHDKINEYSHVHDEFFAKHAEVSVSIAKSLDEYVGKPARGSRATTADAKASGEEIEKGLVDNAQQINHNVLAGRMADVLTDGRAGEFGMSDKELEKAVTQLESTKRIDPAVAAKFTS
jgi:hypothetical protein